SGGLRHQKEKRSMAYFVGLDVSVKVTSPLNAPAQALSGDETKRPMALVNADREIVRKIMTEPGPRWEPQSPPRAENAANFFGGRPMHLSSKARSATCGEAGATPLESRL